METNKDNTRYFVIKRYHCGTSEDTSDILGLTTDEEYAKSRENVFCGYEEVKMISKKTKTLGDYEVINFKTLKKPIIISFNLLPMVYEGFILNDPKTGNSQMYTTWNEEGKCTNYYRKDCFLNVEDIKKELTKIKKPMNKLTGAELIRQEREEQLNKHKMTVEADVQLNSELTGNGIGYPLINGAIALLENRKDHMPLHWNKEKVDHMMKKFNKEHLIIAGALIAAEIDRLEYLENREELK